LNERERVEGLKEWFYFATGQFSRLVEAYHERLALLRQLHQPIGILDLIDNSEALLFAASAGRGDWALAQIDSLSATVEAPWNQLMAQVSARIHMDRRDLEAASAELANWERFQDVNGWSQGNEAHRAWLTGRIAELDGDCATALTEYRKARDINPRHISVAAESITCLAETGRWDEGDETIAWLLDRIPGEARFRLSIARYFLARGDTARAIEHLEVANDIWSEADMEYIPAREAQALLEHLQAK
jgi:tetratricopeptide (TPR) repeat protein